MMPLAIPHLRKLNSQTPLEEISTALDKVEPLTIGETPWSEYLYKPEVAFAVAHTGDSIVLKYFVKEKAIRAVHHEDNSPVHEDSCVEFFIAIDNNEEYYNIEFNCVGACLLGFGKNASERNLVSTDHTRKIRRLVTMKTIFNGTTACICWELTTIIPIDALVFHKLTSLKELNCRVNFYKCGDKLPDPHFLSWRKMNTSTPDFHLTRFFGSAYFE